LIHLFEIEMAPALFQGGISNLPAFPVHLLNYSTVEFSQIANKKNLTEKALDYMCFSFEASLY